MRRLALLLALAATTAVGPAAASTRTLTASFPAADLEGLAIEAGVGDVTLTAEDTATVSVEIELKPRRGGLFSSMRAAEREVERAEIASKLDGRELSLRIDSGSDGDRRFEERWTVVLPARLAAVLDVGVGDVVIQGLAGGVDLELGVGDANLRVTDGDLTIEIGVGDATVRGPASAYASADCSGGVGDALIQAEGARADSDGFVGHSARWDGAGRCRLEVEIGVGDARVVLD